MKRDKTIKYITDTSIDDMVKQILTKKADINHVIDAARESRKEYGLKVQELVERLQQKKDSEES
jgi:hypothetical protein